MASVQDIKRRIRSVRNTRKITRAMELVAAAKLRKAQARIEGMRPYADRMLELMSGTARASTSVRGLPLLQQREREEAVAIVPLTGDRGLAGAFNGFTDQPRYADAQAIAHRLAELYTDEEVDRVVVVYNHFESPLVQRVTVQDVLPLSEDLLETDAEE